MVNRDLPHELEDVALLRVSLTPIASGVLFVLGLNLILVVAGLKTPSRHEDQLVKAKWSLAMASEPHFDWVVLGDSSASLGIDPSVLSEQLGGGVVNLATFGGLGLTGDWWIMDEYLRRHKPPRGFIVVHAAEVWGGGRGDAFYQYAASIPKPTASVFANLISIGSTPSEMIYFLRYRDWFPLLLLKEQARKMLGWSSDKTVAPRSPSRFPPDGSIRLDPSAANQKHVEEHAKNYWEAFGDSVPELGRERHSLMKLMNEASESGSQVYLANGPIVDQVADASDFVYRTSLIGKEIMQLAQANPHVKDMTDQWERFPSHQMENANHVVGTAVDRYTIALARAIKKQSRRNR